MKVLTESRKEDNDDSGIIYDAYIKIREIVTLFNDTVRGRCAICLENFHSDGD